MDDETDWNSFQLRMYDPIIGRWLSTDPYSQYSSPYIGMGNNPSGAVDPDGGYSWLGAFLRSGFSTNLTQNPTTKEWGYYSAEASADEVVFQLNDGVQRTDPDMAAFMENYSYNAWRFAEEKRLGGGGAFKHEYGIRDAIETDPGTALMIGGAATSLLKLVGRSVVEEGIYEFTAASGKTYVGQSQNISRRIQQHIASGKLPRENLSTVKRTKVVGGKVSREVAEQLRINKLGGIKKLENVKNPVGPARQHLLPKL